MFFVFRYDLAGQALLKRPICVASAELAEQYRSKSELVGGISFDQRGLPAIEHGVTTAIVEVRDLLDLKSRYPQHFAAMAKFGQIRPERVKLTRLELTKQSLIEHTRKLAKLVPKSPEAPAMTAREIERRFVEEMERLDSETYKPINRPIRNAPTRREPINGETFACDTCGRISEHDARTITAYHKGYHTYFCDDCHIEHWSNQPGN